ncbi:MAG: aminotransferase class III-fold pyridoxal phosphate-dependent enzyme, partial [Hyphomicrobiaceae bacterium]
MSEKSDTGAGMTSEQVLALILPPSVSHGYGGHLVGSDGADYIDMVSAWGANLLGYGNTRIARAVAAQAARYTNLGMAGPEFAKLQTLLSKHVPCAEAIYLVKNGSDATAAAVRLARSVTGRDKILHRGYHGVQDWYMASIRSTGVPAASRDHIVTLPTLDPASVSVALAAHPGEVACLILDPMVWPYPNASEMAEIASLVRKSGALLVFDEVVSGLRVAVGGMQEVWGVKPDLACLGKGLANGLPIAALVGREEWMRHVYSINYSLTFGLEAVSIVAAIETIGEVVERGVCKELARKGRLLKDAYARLVGERGIASALAGHDCRPQLFFEAANGTSPEVCNFVVVEAL